jgi:hypothetical protein
LSRPLYSQSLSRPLWVLSLHVKYSLALLLALRRSISESLVWTIWHVEQLYTDPALMLDASTRVAAAAGSGLMVAFVNT